MREAFRITPALPAGAFKTYGIVAPRSTHWRAASCAEVDCQAHLSGWRTAVDESTELGRGQAHYIRSEARRSHVEAAEGGLTVFTFEAGQQCFAEHKAPTGRPEIYLVRGGDWRGDPERRAPFIHSRAADWVDDFASHQEALKDRLGKG